MSLKPDRTKLYTKLEIWCQKPDVGWPCPQINDPEKVVNRLWEEMHYYNSDTLDQLIESFEGREHISSTKEVALRRLRPWLEKIFGSSCKIKDPKHITEGKRRSADKAARKESVRNLDENEVQPEEEITMSFGKTEVKRKSVVKGKSAAKVTPEAKVVEVKKSAAKLVGKKSEPKKVDAHKQLDKATRGYKESQVIKVLVSENPKRPGTEAHKRWGLYAKCKTVGAFLEKGGLQINLRDDASHDYIEVK